MSRTKCIANLLKAKCTSSTSSTILKVSTFSIILSPKSSSAQTVFPKNFLQALGAFLTQSL